MTVTLYPVRDAQCQDCRNRFTCSGRGKIPARCQPCTDELRSATARERTRQWCADNPEWARDNSRRWYEQNKERHAAGCRRRIVPNPARQLPCVQCGASFERAARGAIAARCLVCTMANALKARREREQRISRENPLTVRAFVCCDCLATVPVVGSGPLPERCAPCKAIRDKLMSARYRERKATERLAYQRARRLTPIGRAREIAACHRYRARKVASPGAFTAEEFLALCEAYEHRCAYCGCEAKLTADHVIPLSRGGSNWIENILPACKPCNSGKNDRTLDEFLANGRTLYTSNLA